MPVFQFSPLELQQMLQLARWAITVRLGHDALCPNVNFGDTPRACFVTLHKNGQLRGCIGTLQAQDPLNEAIILFARAAAFEDPRFSAMHPDELQAVEIEISVLGSLEAISSQRASLIAQLRPSIDGVVLEDAGHRATFLPQVWQQLPDPQLFLDHLMRKGGWQRWPEQAKAYRYQVVECREHTR